MSPDAGERKRGKGAYSLMVVDGAVEEMPRIFCINLLAKGPARDRPGRKGVTRLAIGTRVGEIALLPLAEIGIPVLAEFRAPKRWSF
jgi:protein-L-isoaspartate(D-aspartate) O-methyltransferase